MRKLIVKAWLFICICILTGCSGKSQSEDAEEQQREEITLWSYYETDNQRMAMDELVKGFNESQDIYHLQWEYHGPAMEFSKKLAIGITQNQLPDMVIIDNPDMLSYIKLNQFEDITEAVKEIEDLDQYFPNAMESVAYQGSYYGLPFCCNNVALIYNKDMLQEKGIQPPTTWEELEKAARILSNKERYGFAMSAVGGEQSSFQFATFMLSAGDDLRGAGGPGTLKAYRFISNLVKEQAMSTECVNWSQNDVARVFIQKKCAMMENGPWVFPALQEAGINYGVARFPADERYMGVLGGENIAVLKGKNVEGSISFLKYYSQINTMLNTNLQANSLPPRKDVARLFLKAKGEYEVILDQVDECISRTSYLNWGELSQLLSEGQYEIITGESTPAQVCHNIREAMQ